MADIEFNSPALTVSEHYLCPQSIRHGDGTAIQLSCNSTEDLDAEFENDWINRIHLSD